MRDKCAGIDRSARFNLSLTRSGDQLRRWWGGRQDLVALCYIIAHLMNGVNHGYDVCLIYGILARGEEGHPGADNRAGHVREIPFLIIERERPRERRPHAETV